MPQRNERTEAAPSSDNEEDEVLYDSCYDSQVLSTTFPLPLPPFFSKRRNGL